MKLLAQVITILFFCFSLTNISYSQNLEGVWDGRFTLEGSSRKWSFELELAQDHANITGHGKQIELSESNQSKNVNSTFAIEGSFNGEYLVYDMTKILTVKSPYGQCLTRCEYKLKETASKYQFIGTCMQNGNFYNNGNYFSDHPACQKNRITDVIIEKAKDIQGRKTEVVESVSVNDSKVIVYLWDNNKVDGDIVSLNLNGEWILKNYQLTRKVKTIELNLPEESNELILFAENLGSVAPNTAAISVWVDGEKKKELIMNSDMGKSEAIRILRK